MAGVNFIIWLKGCKLSKQNNYLLSMLLEIYAGERISTIQPRISNDSFIFEKIDSRCSSDKTLESVYQTSKTNTTRKQIQIYHAQQISFTSRPN